MAIVLLSDIFVITRVLGSEGTARTATVATETRPGGRRRYRTRRAIPPAAATAGKHAVGQRTTHFTARPRAEPTGPTPSFQATRSTRDLAAHYVYVLVLLTLSTMYTVFAGGASALLQVCE